VRPLRFGTGTGLRLNIFVDLRLLSVVNWPYQLSKYRDLVAKSKIKPNAVRGGI
jgi:hypothetical protein